MAADIGPVEAIALEAHLEDCIFYYSIDVSGGYLLRVLEGEVIVSTDGSICILCVLHDVGNPPCQGPDRACGETSAVMVDALATLAILLIGNAESCMCSSVKF